MNKEFQQAGSVDFDKALWQLETLSGFLLGQNTYHTDQSIITYYPVN